MSKGHHLWNMYITAAVSVALVLCLVGFECVLLLSAGTLLKRMKENDTRNGMIAAARQGERFESMLSAADYCSSYRYVSADDALREHVETLGEDPSVFLGYNPLSASYEIHPSVGYAHPDSIAALDKLFTSLPYVDKVLYQENLVKVLNSNVSQAAIVLFVVAIVLLLIACVLIVNTIRLQIYSKRFLINTMTLVGATPWTIKSPFVWRFVLLGTLCSMVAIAAVAGVVYYVQIVLGIVLFPLSWHSLLFVAGTIFVAGILITLFSSLLATGRYIRMNINTMYEI